MPKDITVFDSILKKFATLPKCDTSPTFMELCQLGNDRFEERCSNILQFYLSPDAPHGLHELFIKSLLELTGHGDLGIEKVRILTEEMTSDRKFIDITVVTDSFVIAIENKITASLYNRLDLYAKHIHETYPNCARKIFILLSVKRITDCSEIRKLNDNGYTYINYSDLFEVVKRRLRAPAVDANPRYLTFLFDFIRTIENRYYNRNMELKEFFYKNRNDINHLLDAYKAFENDILRLRKEAIAAIRVHISDATGANWFAWQGWDLITTFNDDGDKLGIECSFRDGSLDNPLGFFCIYITVWEKRHFYPYESALKQAYPDCYIDYESLGRVFLHLPAIDGHETQQIIETLSNCYTKVKRIAELI